MYEARVKAVREAIGPHVDLIIENHSFTDSQSAAQLGNLVKKYNIFYFEEPSTPTPQLSKFCLLYTSKQRHAPSLLPFFSSETPVLL